MRMLRLWVVMALLLLLNTVALADVKLEWVSGKWQKLPPAIAGEPNTYALRTAEKTLIIALDGSWGPQEKYWSEIRPGKTIWMRGVVDGQFLRVQDPRDYVIPQDGALGRQEQLLENPTGVHPVLMILAQYSGSPAPYVPLFAHDQMNGPVASAADEFSFGALGIEVAVTPWLPIALTNTTCTSAHLFQLADQADAAAVAAGFVLGEYAHLVYGFPVNFTCGIPGQSGRGTIGGAPSRAWMSGIFEVKVAVHELIGHNIGELSHGHSLGCQGEVLGDHCTSEDAGDWLTTMGATRPGVSGSLTVPHFSAPEKDFLGWGPAILEGNSSGVYRLGPSAEESATPKALRLPHAGEPGLTFWLEARRAIGFDAFLVDYPLITSGVTWHLNTLGPDGNFLLDMHPETSTTLDGALRAGEVYDDQDAGFALFVVSADAHGAQVAVNRPSDVLTLEVLSGPGTYRVGETLTLRIEATVGTKPAELGTIFWGVVLPGGSWFQFPAAGVGEDGIFQFQTAMVDLPLGRFDVWASAAWWDKVSAPVQATIFLQP